MIPVVINNSESRGEMLFFCINCDDYGIKIEFWLRHVEGSPNLFLDSTLSSKFAFTNGFKTWVLRRKRKTQPIRVTLDVEEHLKASLLHFHGLCGCTGAIKEEAAKRSYLFCKDQIENWGQVDARKSGKLDE